MLEDSSVATKPKMRQKRANKNKKRNWRKHIDISAIESALDAKRLELRTGGLASDKKDAELFFFDTSACNDHVPKSKRLQNKRLRVDEIITPDPDSVKPALKTSRRVTRRAAKTLEKKLERKRTVNTGPNASEVAPYDLWASEASDLYDKFEKKTKVTKHTEQIVGQRSIKRPRKMDKKSSEVQNYKFHGTPAVEVAHPGASYNPTFQDHQELLAKAHEVEVVKIKAKERIDKALHVPYECLPDQGAREKEMQEGLFQDEAEGSSEEETDMAMVTNAPVRAADRKTRRRRRIEAEAKKQKEEKEKAWAGKLRENEVFRTKTFMAEIRTKERKDTTRRVLRKKKKRLVTLSNVKFVEQDIEIKLSDELKGSLRELRPEAGLLTDRYKSLQKRGIVEPRCKRKVPKRRYKIKYQEKRGWREME